MDERQINRLKGIEEEIVVLQSRQAEVARRLYDLHETVIEMLQAELASPLVTPS